MDEEQEPTPHTSDDFANLLESNDPVTQRLHGLDSTLRLQKN
ncbi:hypothetical protein [Candidatus Binatus sp.]